MQIQIINVSSTTKPTKNGSYTMLDVTFKNLTFGGKTDGKKIMSFAAPEVYKVLKDAQNGDTFEVGVKKNADTGYNDWVSIEKAGGQVQASPMQDTNGPAKSFPAPKNNYETPEERAERQVFIIRQSSLTNAISVLKTEKTTPNKEDVFKLAQEMVDWVMQKEPTKSFDITDMDDDIPL